MSRLPPWARDYGDGPVSTPHLRLGDESSLTGRYIYFGCSRRDPAIFNAKLSSYRIVDTPISRRWPLHKQDW